MPTTIRVQFGRVIHESPTCIVREATYGDPPHPCVVKSYDITKNYEIALQQRKSLQTLLTHLGPNGYPVIVRPIFCPLNIEQMRLHIVLPRYEGSLANKLKEYWQLGQTGIPLELLLNYMRNASDALDWLHERGVVHGDVKPSNFLISGKYCALSDFGFLLPPSEHHKPGEKSDSSHLAYVTHEYTAPEIWSHADEPNILSHLTSFSDQFALAATYVELRTGVHPYRRGPVKTTIAILQNKPDLKRLTGPERSVVLKALSNEPTDRYLSCGEFVAELVKCHQEVAMPPRPQAPLVPVVSQFDLNTECIIDENDLNRPYRRRSATNQSKREAWLLPTLLSGLIVAILFAVAVLRYELFATNPAINTAKNDNTRRSQQPPPGPLPQNPTKSVGQSAPLETNKGKINQASNIGPIPGSSTKESSQPPEPTQKGGSNPTAIPKTDPVSTPSIPETLQFRRVVNWQGRDWSSKAGPQANPDLVFADGPRSISQQGNTLSLSITKSGADWHCTELISNDVEYGRYVLKFRSDKSLNELDPRSVFTFGLGRFANLTHDQLAAFELSKWGVNQDTNSQVLGGPYLAEGLLSDRQRRFKTGSTKELCVELNWSAEAVEWKVWADPEQKRPLLNWAYQGADRPTNDNGPVQIRLGFWLHEGTARPEMTDQVLYLREFKSSPLKP